MKQIYLLRHGRAEPQIGDMPDHDRSLDADGLEEAEALAHWMVKNNFSVDEVLCSTASRTQETFGVLRLEHEALPEPTLMENLYLVTAGDMLAKIQKLPDDVNSVLIVGHNPGMAMLAQMTMGAGVLNSVQRMAVMRFSTCTLAKIDVPDTIQHWHDVDPQTLELVDCVDTAQTAGQ